MAWLPTFLKEELEAEDHREESDSAGKDISGHWFVASEVLLLWSPVIVGALGVYTHPIPKSPDVDSMTEIGQLEPVLIRFEQNVQRLDVPVGYPYGVQETHRSDQLGEVEPSKFLI